jgi:ribonuclease P protein subunit RPR2
MRANKQSLVSEIANERISVLFDLAKKCAETDPELSRKYVRHLKRLGTHCRVKLPKEIKNGTCGKCDSVLVPGLSAKVRIASSKRYVVYECLNCKAERHVHY